jgi:hypothetical protein
MHAVRSSVFYPEMEVVSFSHFYPDDGGCAFLRNGTYLPEYTARLSSYQWDNFMLKTGENILTQQG